jgi:hypothetical protein
MVVLILSGSRIVLLAFARLIPAMRLFLMFFFAFAFIVLRRSLREYK